MIIITESREEIKEKEREKRAISKMFFYSISNEYLLIILNFFSFCSLYKNVFPDSEVKIVNPVDIPS